MTPPVPVRGEIEVPGDKSISHRALFLSAMASGRSTIVGLNPGRDVAATRAALAGFGTRISGAPTGSEVEVESYGLAGLQEPEDIVDAANSGTTLRCLMGVAAALPGVVVLTGDASLRRRPMLRVVLPLRQMGATILGAAGGDHAPVCIAGGKLSGIAFDSPVASAQVKTAVLLAGVGARGATSVTEPEPSRDHTERMLAAAGVPVTRSGRTVSIPGECPPEAREWRIPGDFSAAIFLLGAAVLVPGSDLTVMGVGLNPTRTGALRVLEKMGAMIEVDDRGEVGGEPVGTVRVRSSPLGAVTIAAPEVPALIDEIPLLAVVATQAEGTTVIAGAAELKLKESDRVAAMAAGLARLGASVTPTEDGLVIEGPTPLSGGAVDSFGDHRIAMAFAVAGLVAEGPVTVAGYDSASVSFPGFDAVLRAAQGR